MNTQFLLILTCCTLHCRRCLGWFFFFKEISKQSTTWVTVELAWIIVILSRNFHQKSHTSVTDIIRIPKASVLAKEDCKAGPTNCVDELDRKKGGGGESTCAHYLKTGSLTQKCCRPIFEWSMFFFLVTCIRWNTQSPSALIFHTGFWLEYFLDALKPWLRSNKHGLNLCMDHDSFHISSTAFKTPENSHFCAIV